MLKNKKIIALFALLIAATTGTSVSAAGYGGGATSFVGAGGGGSSCPSSLIPPADGFRISIATENSFVYTRNVQLSIVAGNAPRMALSNSPTFDGASIEVTAVSKAWTLTEGEGSKTVYIRFYDNCGVSTPSFSTIVQFTATRPPNVPAPATSGNNNGGLGPVNMGSGIVLGERIALIDELITKVRFGQRSADVSALQRELIRLGFMPRNFRVTNYYGTFTRAGVNAYLASLETDASSNGDATINQLIARTRFATRSEDVRALQRGLIRLGYLRLTTPSNYYGVLTRNAVRRYQAAR